MVCVPLPASASFTPATLILAAARCWRRTQDSGRPVQAALFRTLDAYRCGMLAPAFASLLALYESCLGRQIRVGGPRPEASFSRRAAAARPAQPRGRRNGKDIGVRRQFRPGGRDAGRGAVDANPVAARGRRRRRPVAGAAAAEGRLAKAAPRNHAPQPAAVGLGRRAARRLSGDREDPRQDRIRSGGTRLCPSPCARRSARGRLWPRLRAFPGRAASDQRPALSGRRGHARATAHRSRSRRRCSGARGQRASLY